MLWQTYDAGYEAARAQCNEAGLRAQAQELRTELAGRDRIAREQAKRERHRRSELRDELEAIQDDYDNASDELQRCGDMPVPDAVYQRLRDRATEGRDGASDGSGEPD